MKKIHTRALFLQPGCFCLGYHTFLYLRTTPIPVNNLISAVVLTSLILITTFLLAWPLSDKSLLLSFDSTLLGRALFLQPGCFCLGYHTFLYDKKRIRIILSVDPQLSEHLCTKLLRKVFR